MASVVGSVETMRMMMAVNPKGGGIIELIEHKSRPVARVAYIRDPDGTTVDLVEIKSVAWLSAASFARVALPSTRLYERLI